MRKVYVYYLLLFFLFFFTKNSYSQIANEFWFAAPEISDLHADRPILLRIATFDNPSTVRISIPANPAFVPIVINIPANQSRSVDLTPFIDLIENDPPYTVLNKGIHVTSSSSITAYYEVVGHDDGVDYNSEIFALKGENSLGTHFFAVFQTRWNNVNNLNAFSSIDVVATEDSTVVQFVLTNPIPDYEIGDTVEVLLNRGQTYSLRSNGRLASEKLNGTQVLSNKPITVTLKDDSVVNHSAYDLIGDQIVPVNLLGSEYIVTRGAMLVRNPTRNADLAIVVATEDSTIVEVDGVIVDTLMIGESRTFEVTNPAMYIKANTGIYVFHVSGFGYETAGALLPPTLCTGSQQVSFTRSSDYPFFLNVLVESGAEAGFRLNGNANLIRPIDFFDVPGSNGVWKAAHIEFTSAQIAVGSANRIINTLGYFHVGTINGDATSTSGRYGYFSNFAKLELGRVDEPLCPGEVLVISAGVGGDDYIWSKQMPDSTWEVVGNEIDLSVDTTGRYAIEIQKGLTCNLKDTLTVYYNPDIHVQLGPDTTLCPEHSITIDAGEQFVSYLWHNGSDSRYFQPDTSGLYWIETVNEFNCRTRDTIEVRFRDQFTFEIEGDRESCAGESIKLYPDTIYSAYLWSTGSTLDTIYVQNSGLYMLEVINEYGCKASNQANVYIRPAFTVDLGPDVFICPGENTTLTSVVTPSLPVKYRWLPDEQTTASITVSPLTDQLYSLEVSDLYGCPPVVTEKKVLMNDVIPYVAQKTVKHCFEEGAYRIIAREADTYLWQPNGENSREVYASEPDLYIVSLTNEYGCVTSDSIEVEPICPPRLFVPKAFTPNGDGMNDYVDIFGAHFTNFRMEIFNRWGEIIYVTEDRNQPWDGTYRGELMPDGVYPWVISYESYYENDPENPRRMNGAVTLLK